MRKIFAYQLIFLLLSLSFVVASCGDDEEPIPAEKQEDDKGVYEYIVVGGIAYRTFTNGTAEVVKLKKADGGKYKGGINIPSSITSIGDYAFSDCSSLKQITCKAESVPLTGENVFEHISKYNTKIYVLQTSLNAYKNTSPWKEFVNILPISTQ